MSNRQKTSVSRAEKQRRNRWIKSEAGVIARAEQQKRLQEAAATLSQLENLESKES